MIYTRAERLAQGSIVAIGLAFALAVGGFVFRGQHAAAPSASPSPTTGAPKVTFAQDTCCSQTARALNMVWTSSEKVLNSTLTLAPDPGFTCTSTLDPTGMWGVLGCAALLKGGTDYVATLQVVTSHGTFPFRQKFTTMGNTLTGVKWFTEFEDVTGDPLACAAASVRIVQNYTTGKDPMTAAQILATGRRYNKSKDPGMDPVAIASMQKQLSTTNTYHYYRLATREEATRSAVYWLVRSGKPVHVITLDGQHDPVVIGFTGTMGASYGDPANTITQVVVEDPQRGDLNPATANHRPDKPRLAGFQTGQPVDLAEWYSDEWWLRFAYPSSIKMPDGSFVNIERSDGAYPTPHWAGQFVIIVDDGDAGWPQDKEGRVSWR